jgi:transposase
MSNGDPQPPFAKTVATRPPDDRSATGDQCDFLRAAERLPVAHPAADTPDWNTVYGIFRRWRQAGLWQKIHDAQREQLRKLAGKKPTPTVAIIDGQSLAS